MGGLRHGMYGTPEYRSFTEAKRRCNSKNHKDYLSYGAKGIKFKFKNFEEFFEEVGFKPSKDHSIDRILSSGNYEKGNVRWSTVLEQQRNRSSNRPITALGDTKLLCEWSELYGIRSDTISGRISKHGWCNDCAVSLKKGSSCNHKEKRRIVKREITVGDTTLSLAEWADLKSIIPETISRRIKLGWCNQCAVNIKPNQGFCEHKSENN